ncbi:MAG: phytoene desaturase family protein [Acetobacteraceae bacterium]|nr:phytoene desaturase family protein [Acetobacteraceae bacterium]
MNATLLAPSLQRDRPRIAVIGAGPGGLAAALLLAARGARVVVFEKDGAVGGRTRTITAPGGYRFDLGPTFFLYPEILGSILAECGTRLEDEIALTRLDPQYRLWFEEGGIALDATPDLSRLEAEVAKLSPADAAGIRPFMAENRAKFERFRPILGRAFPGLLDFVKPDMLRSLPLMRPHLTVDADLRRRFRDPRVRLAFSFQTKYLGMSPFRCPSLFTILSFLEYEYGVFHPRGGCGAVSEAMARVAERLGVEFRLSTPVERIVFQGRRVVGIEAGGRLCRAEAAVMNADFAYAMPELVPERLRPRWTDRRIAEARYSCSTFMLYLGIEGAVPEAAHHTIVLAKDYLRNIGEIERGIIPEEPSFYLHNPAVTDPSMAPPGHSALYLLIPVPNLRGGADWEREAPRYREVAFRRLAALGIRDLEPRIRFEKTVTPADWRDRYGVGFGATFNLSHDLGQMMCFRPGNRFAGVEGLYLVGGGTHPGSGLPVIYEGARISAGLLCEDFGLPQRAPAAHAARLAAE